MRRPFRFAIMAGERIELGTYRKPVRYRNAFEPSGPADPARRGRPSASRKRVSQATRDPRARDARAARHVTPGARPAIWSFRTLRGPDRGRQGQRLDREALADRAGVSLRIAFVRNSFSAATIDGCRYLLP